MRGAGTSLVLCLAILKVGVQAIDYVDFIKKGTGHLLLETCILEEELTNKRYDDYDNECFIKKLTPMYENKEQNCCGFDGIQHTTPCKGTDANGKGIDIQNVPICQYPDVTNNPGNHTERIKLKCKKNCELKEIPLTIDEPKNFKVIDDNSIQIDAAKYEAGFCFAHKCIDYGEGWETIAEVCDCNYGDYIEPKVKEFISEIKSTDGKDVKSCCGDRNPLKLSHDKTSIENCPFVCEEPQSLVLKIDDNSTEVIIKMNKAVKKESKSCVGFTLKGDYVYAQCKIPCEGITPCLGKCCDFGHSWNYSMGSCEREDNPADISYMFEKNFKYHEFSEHQNKMGNRMQLYSEEKCEERKISIKDGILMYFNKSSNKEIKYRSDQFCYTEVLGGKRQDGKNGTTIFFVEKNNQTDDSTKSGINSADKELAYTIILAFSTILLFITIFIYVTHTALWKHYSKLMVNFAASLFVANILLLMIWKAQLTDNCIQLGLALQFFFLATFTWMTIMSWEIFIQLKSSTLVNHGNDHKRIAKQACIGYGFPLFMIFVTLIVELSAPDCAVYRPRFDMKNCGIFFGSTDKFLWLYGPILVMLLLNTGMMIFIFYSVFKQKTRKEGRGSNRSQKYDMICLYLRLFLGMGFIWYFEILSWAVNPRDDGWMITDIFNMLQGTYVFFIFVCKRNVLAVVFGKRSRLYSITHQASVKFKGGKTGGLMAQGSQDTEQSEFSQSLVTDKATVALNPSP